MRHLAVSAGCLVLAASLALAEAPKNRIWFTWEQRAKDGLLCAEKGYCDPVSRFITRLAEETDRASAEQITGSMDRIAESQGRTADHPEAPNWCQQTDAQTILGFEAESWPLSDKIKALEGLQGVYFDFNRLKVPDGFVGDFGPLVHAEAEQKFKIAGIPVLTEDEVENTPGKPMLAIYFSLTNPDTGCWFSVFASLTQTMLLTRNHTTKLRAGTWGFSGGYNADFPNRSEYEAIMLVLDKFIDDFKRANPNGVQG